MANTLNLYDPFFYANEALIQLRKTLGMSAAVHRGYDPNPQQPGSTIQISRPGQFTASAMPHGTGTATDLSPDGVAVVLNQWYGVTFKLTDKELTFTKEKIITDHIGPAAYAVADRVDQSLFSLYKDVPASYDVNGTAAAFADLTQIQRQMFDQQVPQSGRSLVLNGERQAGFLNLVQFTDARSAVDAEAGQREGSMGRKVGFDIWASQNIAAHSPGGLALTAATVANASKGATTLTITGTTVTGSVNPGDIVTLAGITQKYAVASQATAAGNSITFSISPALQADITTTPAPTMTQSSRNENLAFHKNAFTLAMAPLSDIGNNLGAKIASVVDPISGLALRSSMWYEGGPATVFVRIDALWGVKTLDPRLAVRYRSA